MDTQEACPTFKILEGDIAEEDENIVIDWYLRLFFLYYEKGVMKLNFYVKNK